MELVLTEIVGEKYISTIIMGYISDLEKYEKLQKIDNGILKQMDKMTQLIELNTKPVKHLISKKLLKLERDMGVNVSYDSDSSIDVDDEDGKIKKYYERRIGIDDYDLQYCRDHIANNSKDRYILLGGDEFDKTPIILRDDFINEESDSESDDDNNDI